MRSHKHPSVAAVISALLALCCAAVSPAAESSGPRSDAQPFSTRAQPTTLLVDARQAARGVMPTHLRYETRSVAYYGGARYPHLVRIAARPDMLARIVAPRAH